MKALLVRPRRLGIDPRWEKELRQEGFSRIAGVDEAGRGCLFGPVAAAAVILADPHGLRGVDDSKQLAEAERERLFDQIVRRALSWSVAMVDAATIDRVNILEASRLGVYRRLACCACHWRHRLSRYRSLTCRAPQ